MNTMNNKLIEALKARAEQIKNRKPLTQEEVRERLMNSPFFKRVKEAQAVKLNAEKKEE